MKINLLCHIWSTKVETIAEPRRLIALQIHGHWPQLGPPSAQRWFCVSLVNPHPPAPFSTMMVVKTPLLSQQLNTS